MPDTRSDEALKAMPVLLAEVCHRVLEAMDLHQPREAPHSHHCGECGQWWPCPTVRMLNGTWDGRR